MMYWGDHMSAGEWIFSILGTLIVVVVVILAIYWVVSAIGDRVREQPARGSARKILDRRLATGELTVEQYEQLRATLARPDAATPDHIPPRAAVTAG